MTDTTKLGPWIRQFLLEHLVAERNLARNAVMARKRRDCDEHDVRPAAHDLDLRAL